MLAKTIAILVKICICLPRKPAITGFLRSGAVFSVRKCSPTEGVTHLLFDRSGSGAGMFSPSRSGPLHPQKEASQQMASPKPHDISFGASPGRAQSAGAGAGLGARGELAFDFAREPPVGGDLQHRAGR